MAATFTDLQKAFELHINAEGEIDSGQLVIWFNEAQLDLALDCGKIVRKVMIVEPGALYDLPEGCLELVTVEGSDYERTLDGKIVFATGGEILLYYRQNPQPFTGTDSDQVSQLHPALHDLIPIFAAARYWDRESEGDYEESGLGTKWMNYYLQGKEQRRQRLEGIYPKVERWQVI